MRCGWSEELPSDPNSHDQRGDHYVADEIVDTFERIDAMPVGLKRERQRPGEICCQSQNNCRAKQDEAARRPEQKPFAHGQTKHDACLERSNSTARFADSDKTGVQSNGAARGLRLNSKPMEQFGRGLRN